MSDMIDHESDAMADFDREMYGSESDMEKIHAELKRWGLKPEDVARRDSSFMKVLIENGNLRDKLKASQEDARSMAIKLEGSTHDEDCPYDAFCDCGALRGSPITNSKKIVTDFRSDIYLEFERVAIKYAKDAEYKFGVGAAAGIESLGHEFGNKARKLKVVYGKKVNPI